MGITFSPLKSGFADQPSRGVSDIDLFLMHVAMVRSGGDYYESAKLEMESRGYPTRSVFNWRTPLPIWLVAQLPSNCVGIVITSLLGICVLMFGCVAVAREGGLGRAGLVPYFSQRRGDARHAQGRVYHARGLVGPVYRTIAVLLCV